MEEFMAFAVVMHVGDEVVKAYDASPKGSELARSTTSSKVLNGTMGATGPNGSSVMILQSSGTSVITVGWKKKPWLPCRLPPVAILPPRALASFTKLSMA